MEKQLRLTIMDKSESKGLKKAIQEWYVSDCRIDNNKRTKCVCGQEGLKYVFTITNELNGNVITPIGSSCIELFENDVMTAKVQYLLQKHAFMQVIKSNARITFGTELFSRKFLQNLYAEGAFIKTKWNKGNGENDYQFMLDMFNKRNKHEITQAQHRKLIAVTLNSIKPFLVKQPMYKEI